LIAEAHIAALEAEIGCTRFETVLQADRTDCSVVLVVEVMVVVH